MHKKQAYNNFYYYQSIWFPVAFSLDGSITITVGRSRTLVLIHFIIFKITAANTSCSPQLHCGMTVCLSPCQKGFQIHLFRFGSCRYAYTLRCWIIAVGMTSSNWVTHNQIPTLTHGYTQRIYYYIITCMHHENWLWLWLQLQLQLQL